MFFYFLLLCFTKKKELQPRGKLSQVEKENDGGGACVKMINIDKGMHKRALEKEALFDKGRKKLICKFFMRNLALKAHIM